jgi:4-alpha-glucanotransferase
LRETGYQYYIQTLRSVLPYVGLLRLDHVMGLHRLYCIPEGHPAKDGAFIRYPAEELYAILCLESHRYQTCIIGENLGTVPNYINQALSRHRLYRLNVLQYEIDANHDIVPNNITRNTVSSINTHDMPPFAAFLQGLDLTDSPRAEREWRRRKQLNPRQASRLPLATLRKTLRQCLLKLQQCRSQFLLISLEDLLLETKPQNIPISGAAYPNWRRRIRKSFDQWRRDRYLCATINSISQFRRKGNYKNDQ